MKKRLLLLSAAMLCMISAYAQEAGAEQPKSDNLVNHKVEMGETVMLIAKKYRIKPTDIYAFNPDAVNGITHNTVLHIPADRKYVPKSKKSRTDEDEVSQAATAHRD
jgi:LysM repeat protein